VFENNNCFSLDKEMISFNCSKSVKAFQFILDVDSLVRRATKDIFKNSYIVFNLVFD
jgi:hypothetical protein